MTRPQGILTPDQRAFLKSEDVNEEYSRQKRYRFRKNIRQRVRNAMMDFHLLARELPDDQLREIFEVKMEEHQTTDGDEIETNLRISDANVTGYIPQVFAFLARAEDLDDNPIIPRLGHDQPALSEFAISAEKGLQSFLAAQKRISAKVSVSIELENVEPIEELVQKAERGDDLPDTWDFLRVLSGDLTDEERDTLQQALEERADSSIDED